MDNWINEFLLGPEQFQRSDMIATMRRAGEPQPVIDAVVKEVEAARTSYADFVRSQNAGSWGAA